MKKNIGSADKIVRIVLGVIIIAWGIYAQNWLGIIGLIPLVTAFVGTCPLYLLLGLSTDKKVDVKKVKI